MELQQLFHEITRVGNLGRARELIGRCKVDPYCKDPANGATALHYASGFGHLHVVRYLSETEHCNARCRDDAGDSPLHYAAARGHMNVLDYLVASRGCSPMMEGSNRVFPIVCAGQNGRIAVVKYLIEKCDVSPLTADTDSGATLLDVACLYGHLDIVKYISARVSKGSSHDNIRAQVNDRFGCSPLHWAALGGCVHVMHYLMRDLGGDPMCRGWWGRTPLHYACLAGHIDACKFLLNDARVDPFCHDKHDLSPLALAEKNGHTDIFDFIYDKYISPHVKAPLTCFKPRDVEEDVPSSRNLETFPSSRLSQNQLQSEVIQACCRGDLAAMKCLISFNYKSKANLNIMLRGDEETGVPLMHIAANFGYLHIVKYLEGLYRNPGCIKDKDGNTVIHWATVGGHLHTVQYVIAHGHCSPMSVGWGGKTPLHLACQEGYVDIVKYLVEEQRVSIACKDKTGCTPLQAAEQRGHCRIAAYLLSPEECKVGNSTLELQMNIQQKCCSKFIQIGLLLFIMSLFQITASIYTCLICDSLLLQL